MIWKIIAVGKPALVFAKSGIEEYTRRLGAFTKVDCQFVKTGPHLHERMLELSDGCHRIILDERGRVFSSRDFAGEVQKLRNRSVSRIALLVGGSEGWDDAMRSRADLLWSLGPQTLQHEIALLVAVEQIYRAETILAGTPYHRD